MYVFLCTEKQIFRQSWNQLRMQICGQRIYGIKIACIWIQNESKSPLYAPNQSTTQARHTPFFFKLRKIQYRQKKILNVYDLQYIYYVFQTNQQALHIWNSAWQGAIYCN